VRESGASVKQTPGVIPSASPISTSSSPVIPSRSPVIPSEARNLLHLTEEQFRQLMIAALEESPRARDIVRQAFLPSFPIHGAVPAQNYIPYFTDNNPITGLGDSVMYQNSGRIGIGTTTPAYGLDINANVIGVGTTMPKPGFGGSLRYRDDTGTPRWLFGLLGSTGAVNFNVSDMINHFQPFIVQPGAPTNLFVLTPAGVGIGTASPAAKLDVAGGINASGNVGLGVTSPPEKLTAATGSNLAIYMSTPGQPNGNPTIATGGTLSGNYWYKIVAVDGQGNTTAAGQESAQVTVSGSNNAVSLNWTAVPGASSYRVYRGTSSGGENLYYAVYTNSLLDIGAAGTSGTPPSTTAAYFVKLDSVSGSVLAGNVILGGAQTKQASGGPELVSFQSQDNSRVVHASWGAVGAPGLPVLSQTSGGSNPQTTYYVKITWITPSGESLPSAEASLLVLANNVLNVTNPAGAPASAKGFNVYVSTSSGTETKQNGSIPVATGTTWTEPTTGLISGSALPTANTAVDTNARLLIDIQGNHEWAASGDVDQSILMGFNQVGVLGLQADPQKGGGINIAAWKHTTLTAGVNSTDQQFSVVSTSQFQDGDHLRVDNEIVVVQVNGITSGTTMNVDRGQGSTAAAHGLGAYVTLSGQSEDYARVSIQTANEGTGTTDIGPRIGLGSGAAAADTWISYLAAGGLAITGGNIGIDEASPDYKLDVNGAIGFTPGSSVTPVDDGDVVFELTSNTTLTIKAKGTDHVVRSATITLS
jgi:hypothetical protein